MTGPEDGAASGHRSVLFREALEHWLLSDQGVYVDGTFGRGGHSRGLLSRLSPAGHLFAVDRDPAAIPAAVALQGEYENFDFEHAAFADLYRLVSARGWEGKVDGILLDLGVSSPQLDTAERGFSFSKDGPLDMRMNPQQGISAGGWIATTAVEEMTRVFRELGEERFARRIARAIDERRSEQAIESTSQLAGIIAAAAPVHDRHKHPATRVFQAIRIEINGELEQLQSLLQECTQLLRVGGRLVVISFHSLEDRMVKRFMREQARGPKLPRSLPVRAADVKPNMRIVGKAIRASDEELQENPRARSAIMRVAEKC